MRFEKSVIKKSITEISIERFNCILDSEKSRLVNQKEDKSILKDQGKK